VTIEEPGDFHRRVAEELTRRYGKSEQAPPDWRETLAWHWEQAGAYAEAADATLEIAEARMTHLDFSSARRWAERTLTLIERLDRTERQRYDLRAYALALAVLEFGGQYREGLDYARRMLSVAQARGRPGSIETGIRIEPDRRGFFVSADVEIAVNFKISEATL
jgi:hypothetical protein